MTIVTTKPAPRRALAVFEKWRVQHWPVWARKFFVLGFLPRKSLTHLPFTTSFGPYVYSGDAANLIDYHMLSRGSFEPGLARLLRDWAHAHSGTVFLDVGANVGVHTLALAPVIKKIVAVEPFPPVADRLCATLDVNKITNVAVKRVALSDHAGTVSFRVPESGNLGVGRVVADGTAGTLLQLPQQTGDELLSDEPLPVSLIKIDVEGFELAVLGGLQARLTKDRPLVVVEVLTENEDHVATLMAKFPSHYLFFRLHSARRTTYRVSPWHGESGDIVALPEEKAAFLAKAL